jgi:hypothetical protein
MGDSLWRDREFVRYWAGQTVSQVGSQVTQLALPLFSAVRRVQQTPEPEPAWVLRPGSRRA